MDARQAAQVVVEGWKTEIERAIDRVKEPRRSGLDNWFRQEWHRAAAISKWPEERQRRYWEWRQHQQTPEELEWQQTRTGEAFALAWMDQLFGSPAAAIRARVLRERWRPM